MVVEMNALIYSPNRKIIKQLLFFLVSLNIFKYIYSKDSNTKEIKYKYHYIYNNFILNTS